MMVVVGKYVSENAWRAVSFASLDGDVTGDPVTTHNDC